MENNYILLGLIILTVACIYLFYTNFQKNKEYEQLVEQVNQLKFENQYNKQTISSKHNSEYFNNNIVEPNNDEPNNDEPNNNETNNDEQNNNEQNNDEQNNDELNNDELNNYE